MKYPLPFTQRYAGGIYAIVCYPTGDCYVGASRTLLPRMGSHNSNINCSDQPLYKSIRSIGGENFNFEIIYQRPAGMKMKELLSIEEVFIKNMEPSLNSIIGGIRRGIMLKGSGNPDSIAKIRAKINQ